MKKLILIVLVIGISFPLLAQQSTNLFEQLTEKYADKEGFSASKLTSDMFDLYLKKKNVDDASDVATALNKLDNILVVSENRMQSMSFDDRARYGNKINNDDKKPEKSEKDGPDLMHKEILDYYKSNDYTLLKTEKRMGEDVKVYLKKSNNGIKALALITKSSFATNLVELQGDIDLTTVASLNKAINLRGLENLYKIDNSSPYAGRFPTSGYIEMSEERIAEIEARAREMAERHAELSQEQRAKIEQQAQLQAHKQMEMAEKYREMAEQYGRQPIFLSTPGDTNTVFYLNGKKIKAEDMKKKLKTENIEQVVKTQDDKEGKTVIKITTK